MKRRHIVAALAYVSIVSWAQPASAENWIIDATRSVGPIGRESSEDGMAEALGADNVKHADIEVGEGMTEPGTVLFPADATKRIELLWKDKDHRTSPRSMIIRNEGTVWKTLAPALPPL